MTRDRFFTREMLEGLLLEAAVLETVVALVIMFWGRVL